ncbi:hypothetical protein PQX77_002709, partial [Marasmius sp. AFHP31]
NIVDVHVPLPSVKTQSGFRARGADLSSPRLSNLDTGRPVVLVLCANREACRADVYEEKVEAPLLTPERSDHRDPSLWFPPLPRLYADEQGYSP